MMCHSALLVYNVEMSDCILESGVGGKNER